MEDFNKFWIVYPHKVAKLAAMRAFEKAIKIATAEEIIQGVGRYIANKPDHVDFCHPATWLNGGRWMDEYAAPSIPRPSPSVVAIQNQKELERVETRMGVLRNQRPFTKGDKRIEEFDKLSSRRKQLLGLMNFAA